MEGNTFKEDILIELTNWLFNEANNLQGIVQTLEQCLKLMVQNIYKKIHEQILA